MVWAVLLQRGLRFNKTSKELWLAYYDVELKCLQLVMAQRAALGLSDASAVDDATAGIAAATAVALGTADDGSDSAGAGAGAAAGSSAGTPVCQRERGVFVFWGVGCASSCCVLARRARGTGLCVSTNLCAWRRRC